MSLLLKSAENRNGGSRLHLKSERDPHSYSLACFVEELLRSTPLRDGPQWIRQIYNSRHSCPTRQLTSARHTRSTRDQFVTLRPDHACGQSASTPASMKSYPCQGICTVYGVRAPHNVLSFRIPNHDIVYVLMPLLDFPIIEAAMPRFLQAFRMNLCTDFALSSFSTELHDSQWSGLFCRYIRRPRPFRFRIAKPICMMTGEGSHVTMIAP